MELRVANEGKRVRFSIKGVIDERGAEQIKKEFQSLNLSSATDIIFDFREVSHIGSAGIGKLLLLYKDLAIYGGNLSVENTSAPVFDLFRVLKLDSLFKVSRV